MQIIAKKAHGMSACCEMQRVSVQFMMRAEEAEKKVQELRSDVSVFLNLFS